MMVKRTRMLLSLRREKRTREKKTREKKAREKKAREKKAREKNGHADNILRRRLNVVQINRTGSTVIFGMLSWWCLKCLEARSVRVVVYDIKKQFRMYGDQQIC